MYDVVPAKINFFTKKEVLDAISRDIIPPIEVPNKYKSFKLSLLNILI